MMSENNNLSYVNSPALNIEINSNPIEFENFIITVQGREGKATKNILLLPKLHIHDFIEFPKLDNSKKNNESQVTSDNGRSSFLTDHTYCIDKNIKQSNNNLAINNGTSLLNTDSVKMPQESVVCKENYFIDENNLKNATVSDKCNIVENESNFIDQLYCDEIFKKSNRANEFIPDEKITEANSENTSEESFLIHIQTEFVEDEKVDKTKSQNIEKNYLELDQKESNEDKKISNTNPENAIGEKLSQINQKEFVDDKINDVNSQNSIDNIVCKLNERKFTNARTLSFINSRNRLKKIFLKLKQKKLMEINKVGKIKYQNNTKKKMTKIGKKKLFDCGKLNNVNSQNNIEETSSIHTSTSSSKRLSADVDTSDSLKAQSSSPSSSPIKIQEKEHLTDTKNSSDDNLNEENKDVSKHQDFSLLASSGWMSKKRNVESFKCGICKKEFDTIELFDKHAACHVHIKYKCKDCNESFINDYEELEKHFIDIHMGKIVNKPMKTESTMEIESTMKTESDVNQQTNIHVLKNPFFVTNKKNHCKKKGKYSCNICSFKLKYMNGFRRHKKNHEDLFSTYRCISTSSSFSSRKELKIHVNNCLFCKEILKCQFCQEICTDKLHFYHHTKSHKIENSYYCNLCCYSTISFRTLIKHMQSHSDKLYVCHDCGQTSNTKKSLQEHWYHSHELVKNLFCSACHQDFDGINLLVQHMKTQHKNHFMQWMAEKMITFRDV